MGDDFRREAAVHPRRPPRLLGITKRNGKSADLLESLWNSIWALGHIATLLAPEARETGEILDAVPAEPGSNSKPIDTIEAIGRSVAEWSTVGLIARASYWAARAGKYALPGYKRYFFLSLPFHHMAPQAAGLAAIGLRHQRLRAEVREALGSHMADAPDWNPPPLIVAVQDAPAFTVAIRKFLAFVREQCDVAFDRPDEATRAHRKVGRELAIQLFALEPAGSAYHYASKEDIRTTSRSPSSAT